MSDERLVVEKWRGPGFGPLDFALVGGGFVWLAGGRAAAAAQAVDGLFGLGTGVSGTVRWFGGEPVFGGERGWREVALRVSHLKEEGGLLSNLRIWENIVLPAWHRGGSPDRDETERKVLEALAVTGRDEERSGKLLADRVEELSQGERVLAMLVRAHLCSPEVLVCESVFDGLPDDEAAECRALLDWLAGRHPGLALLVVGDEAPDGGRFGLSAWGDPAILSLEEGGTWCVS